MQVQEVMTGGLVRVCSPEDTLAIAARRLWDHDIGALPVVDREGVVVGMITDRDICMGAYTQGRALHEVVVSSVMSHPPRGCRREDALRDVLRRLAEHQFRRMPVMDERGQLVGIISLNDIARAALLFEDARVPAEEALEALVEASRPRRRPMVRVGIADDEAST